MGGLPVHASDRPEPQALRRRPPAISEIVAVLPRGHGVVELQLSCGHSVRRRLALCPPTRLACAACQADAARAGAEAAPEQPDQL